MAFIRLAEILGGERSPDHPLALAGEEIRTHGEFLRAAAAVAGHARGGGRWILACEDAWDFLAGLFGLLGAGCTVAIPPNLLAATLERMEPGTAGTLGRVTDLPPGRPLAGPLDDGLLEFWTSGSTGEAKRVVKRLAQLDAEVRMLEEAFGARCGEGAVRGTVPHHHIYGCLFRLLWPLAAGRTLALEPWGLQSLPEGAPILVSSPALLSRLPRLLDLDARAPVAAVAFSSGGPLARADALAWRRWVPGGVVEIYGSTETGGIAWRNQSEAEDSVHWTPFPDVALAFEPDGALRVASPRAGPAPLRMEDAAEALPDGRFRLGGRLDRIVKLEEKRIALPELEAALEAHPCVERAALVLLDEPRPCLGAVAVLTAQGRTRSLEDRRGLVRDLRRHLALRFEGVAVPRRWRFMEALPLDARGKLLPRALADLFAAHGRSAGAMRTLPEVLGHCSGEEEVFTLAMDADLLAFQGHFPGNPVLPGVVQVDWAIRLGERVFGALGPFQAITHLKFMALIRPGDAVELHLALDPGRERLRFSYSGPTGPRSSGTVVFGPPAPPA